MRRAGRTLVGCILIAGALCAPASGDGSGLTAQPAGAVSVTAREFSLTLSRPRLRAGEVRIQLINRGEDDHDLLAYRDDAHSWRFRVTRPGEALTRTLRLGPGRYSLICTLEGHQALGMEASLRVTRRRPSSN